MSGFRPSSGFSCNSGTTAVTSITMTVPTGVVSTDNILIALSTATSTAGGHALTGTTGSGTLSVPSGGLNGQTIGTSWKVTTLLGTGHVAGDVLTFSCPASGLTTGAGGAWDNTYTFDACGTALTSGSTAAQTVPAVTTSAANCLCIAVAVGGQTATRNVSSASPGTLEFHLDGAGGNTRWTAIGFADQVVVAAGSSGTQGITFSGTLSGSAGIQISMKPAATNVNGAATLTETVGITSAAVAGAVGSATLTETVGITTAAVLNRPYPMPTAVAARSPLIYLRLDDPSGTTAADSSGNSHPGVYGGSPTLGAAGLLALDPDTAVTFNGSTQYVNVAGASYMNVADYTVVALVKSTATSARVIARDDASSNKVFGLGFDASGHVEWTTYSLVASTGQPVTSTATFNDGQPHILMGVKSGTTQTLYVDGAQVAQSTFTDFHTSTTQSIDVARRGAGLGFFLAGTVDEFSFYGTGLSAADAVALYYAFLGTLPESAALTETVGITTTGVVGTQGSATVTETVGITAAATAGAQAASTVTETVGITAAAVAGKQASAAATETVSITATAAVGAQGTASVATAVTITATATVGATGLNAAATVTETVNVTSAGVVGAQAAATVTPTVSVTSAATVGAQAAAAVTPAVTITATATVTAGLTATATTTETVTITAAATVGTRAAATVTETVGIASAATVGTRSATNALTETVGITTTGVVGATAGAQVAETVSITSAATLGKQAAATVTPNITTAATAAVGAQAGALLTAAAGITAAGQVGARAAATVPVAVGITAAVTFGKSATGTVPVAVTITATAFVDSNPVRDITIVAGPALTLWRATATATSSYATGPAVSLWHATAAASTDYQPGPALTTWAPGPGTT